MNGKEAVMVCLKVLSQRFLGWSKTTDKMLVRVAGLDWIPAWDLDVKQESYQNGSDCKYCLLYFVLVHEKNVLR